MHILKLKTLSLGIFLLLPSLSWAQTKDTNQANDYQDEIFVVVEEYPQFPGGEEARFKFLADHTVFPNEAKSNNIQGRVIVGFIVEKDGSITNVKVLKSANRLLDAEAIRVTKLMPKWEPGKQKGKKVRCQYQMPIVFVITY
ncbi:MAG: energy transducer TonB [Bacteroidales bacterium]|jgi:TonB family protein|nr:energy transducer TonB [Bacteroidales bacterium]